MAHVDPLDEPIGREQAIEAFAVAVAQGFGCDLGLEERLQAALKQMFKAPSAVSAAHPAGSAPPGPGGQGPMRLPDRGLVADLQKAAAAATAAAAAEPSVAPPFPTADACTTPFAARPNAAVPFSFPGPSATIATAVVTASAPPNTPGTPRVLASPTSPPAARAVPAVSEATTEAGRPASGSNGTATVRFGSCHRQDPIDTIAVPHRDRPVATTTAAGADDAGAAQPPTPKAQLPDDFQTGGGLCEAHCGPTMLSETNVRPDVPEAIAATPQDGAAVQPTAAGAAAGGTAAPAADGAERPQACEALPSHPRAAKRYRLGSGTSGAAPHSAQLTEAAAGASKDTPLPSGALPPPKRVRNPSSKAFLVRRIFVLAVTRLGASLAQQPECKTPLLHPHPPHHHHNHRRHDHPGPPSPVPQSSDALLETPGSMSPIRGPSPAAPPLRPSTDPDELRQKAEAEWERTDPRARSAFSRYVDAVAGALQAWERERLGRRASDAELAAKLASVNVLADPTSRSDPSMTVVQQGARTAWQALTAGLTAKGLLGAAEHHRAHHTQHEE